MRIRTGFRKLKLPSGTWRFRVGKKSVLIYSPAGTRHCPDHLELLSQIYPGITWQDIERAHWKRTEQANITPAIIRSWIEAQEKVS